MVRVSISLSSNWSRTGFFSCLSSSQRPSGSSSSLKNLARMGSIFFFISMRSFSSS